jgi:hypothetical protein
MAVRFLGFVFVFIIFSACFHLLMRTQMIWRLSDARRKGLYPAQGKATLFDVKKLLASGEKLLAVRLYGEIYHTSTKESLKSVEELEKSIQEKKAKS